MNRASIPFIIDPKGTLGVRSTEVIHALRKDAEATDIELCDDNIDISIIASTNRLDKDWIEASARCFIDIISSAPEVITNRLHVAIGACLADRRCVFYNNNYFKCEAIYKHSLKKRFPKLVWAGTEIIGDI